MRIQTSALRHLPVALLTSFCLLFMTALSSAQDEPHPPAPQFLYRNENHLVLVDGYTGEASNLPFDLAERDRFEWSPDGKYLLAHLQDGDLYTSCLQLYDVDARAWVNKEPISCGVQDTAFSTDGTRLVYDSNTTTNGSVWLYNVADGKNERLYQTTEGDEMNPNGIASIHWSPTEAYLTFVHYHIITGGTLNTFVVMKAATRDHVTVMAPEIYYASYDPIWSADDRWFLMLLKEQYVTSGAIGTTNHAGDLYLVNTDTGEKYRLTYTPAGYEANIHWTDDGKIAFTELIEQNTTLTTEQAMHVEPVPPHQIVMPEPVDTEEFANAARLSGVIVSPDTYVGAWVSSTPDQSDGYDYELKIGDIFWTNTVKYSALLPASYKADGVLIGWRPSDYPYPLG